MTHPYFEVRETEEDSRLRLSLSGELDMMSAASLEDRFDHLAAQQRSVLLDLSKLEFIDSAGLRVLVRAVQNARRGGWALEVDPQLSRQVDRVVRLTELEDYIFGASRRPSGG